MENHCISIDWLQTYCLGNLLTEGRYIGALHVYEVKKEDKQTALFQDVFKVSTQGMEVAEILQTPRSSAITPKSTCLKLHNRILYCQQYISILYDIQNTLSLTYKGITRIDICYDCNAFKGGRSVPRFLKQFMNSAPGDDNHIYRRGSDAFAAHGKKSSSSVSSISSMRFGSPKSRIGAYIYDKTLELKEVKDKPWIKEVWEENGLVSDEKTHVWRAEISIKAEGADVLNMSTGELFKLSPRYLEHASQVYKLFYIYAAKYFDFRISNGAKQKKNYKKLELFEMTDKVQCRPYYFSKSADTGRMEKICFNKIQKLSREYSNLSEYYRNALEGAMKFLLELQGKKEAVVRLHTKEQYLNNLYGQKFMEHEDMLYFGAIESLRQAKIDYDADALYDILIETPRDSEQDFELNAMLQEMGI